MLTGDKEYHRGSNLSSSIRSRNREGLLVLAMKKYDETIQKAAEASMREVVGKSKIDEALTLGQSANSTGHAKRSLQPF